MIINFQLKVRVIVKLRGSRQMKVRKRRVEMRNTNIAPSLRV